MKKHLLTTTAAVALTGMVAAPAAAQEWDVTVGGFFTGNLFFAQSSGSLVGAGEDFDGIQTHINTEVHFKPSITLDNGMTFGAHIELEGNTSGDQIDESYMYVTSDTLGRIEVGSENSAGYKSMIGAPGTGGFAINSGSQSAFLPVEINADDVLGLVTADDGLTYTADIADDGDLLPESVVAADEVFGGEFDGDLFAAYDPALADVRGADTGIVNELEEQPNAAALATEEFSTTNFTVAQLLDESTELAGYLPGDSIEINYFNIDGVMVDPTRFRNAFGSSFTETAGNNDANRISYYTPSLGGLVIGVSYAADASQGNALNDRNDSMSDFMDIGASYSQSMGGMDLTLGARYGTADASGTTTVFDLDGDGNFQVTDPDVGLDTTDVANGDPETWAVGFQLGYDAFTFGASYAENESGIANDAGDSEGFSLGATYNTGVWTLGAEMISGEATLGDVLGTNATFTAQEGGDITTTAADTNRATVKAEQMTYKFGATRSLGSGVSWSVYGIHTEQKAKANGATVADVDATAIGTAIALNF